MPKYGHVILPQNSVEFYVNFVKNSDLLRGGEQVHSLLFVGVPLHIGIISLRVDESVRN